MRRQPVAFLKPEWVGRVVGRFNHCASPAAEDMPTRTDIAIYADHDTCFGEPDQVKRKSHPPCVDGRRVGK
ncbi:MAG: hypothetical protein NTY57_07300 [Solirubrobacterales bacterium]|nr:hypothetical protein [Solirubrobacterales bacterium]